MTEENGALFQKWWDDHGQYVRAGGGEYEISFAYEAWQHQQSRIDELEQENAELLAQVSAARAEAIDDAAQICSDKEEQFNEPADDYEIGYTEAAQDIYGKIIALKDETK